MRRRKLGWVVTAAGFLAWVSAGIAGAQCYYTYTPIPKPPGWLANPGQSINNLGAVAGILQSGGDNYRVYTWSPETGTVVLPLPPGIISMDSAYINDAGVVAGFMTTAGPPYLHRGYVWNGSTYTTINLPSWANWIYVRGINNRGEVSGTIWNVVTGQSNPFVWRDGVLTNLGAQVAPDLCWGEAIDDRGRVAGDGPRDGTAPRLTYGFFLRAGFSPWLTHPDGASSVYAASNTDFVTGLHVPPGGTQGLGAIWLPSGELELVPPPALWDVRSQFWLGVNDAGRVVGYSYPGNGRANVWQSGSPQLLEDLVSPPAPSRVVEAWGINQVGQIVVGLNLQAGVLTPHWVPGDLTGDCHVTLDDLVLVLMNFGSPVGTFPMGDVNADGAVDLTDLAVVLSHWGE